MNILQSAIAPYLSLIVVVAIAFIFFRKFLQAIISSLVVLTILFIVFPMLLGKYQELVLAIRTMLTT